MSKRQIRVNEEGHYYIPGQRANGYNSGRPKTARTVAFIFGACVGPLSRPRRHR